MIKEDLNILPQDRVGFNFENTENIKLSFGISFRRYDQYSPELILAALERVLQSNERFFVDENLVINIDHVKVPIGYGRRQHIGKSSEEFFKLHKNSMFINELKDEHSSLCLATAIVVSIAYATNINLYNSLTYKRNYLDLIGAAQKFCSDSGVDLSNGGGIDEFIKFQNFIGTEYRMTVFMSRDGHNIYFKSCHFGYKYTINLLLDNEHYSVILGQQLYLPHHTSVNIVLLPILHDWVIENV